MDFEKMLSNDMRLDMFLSEYPTVLHREIEELRYKNPDKDILDIDVEFNNLTNLQASATLAYVISKRLLHHDDHKAYEVMYRSIVFSCQIARAIQGDDSHFDAGRYLVTVIDKPDGYQQIINDTRHYLSDNPHVDNLLDYYADELDGGRGYQHLVELAGALVFMLSERSLAERLIADEVSGCSMEELSSE